MLLRLVCVLCLIACASATTYCAQDGADYTWSEAISSDGKTRTITTNLCPNHPTYNSNPNRAVSESKTWTIPAKPEFIGAESTVSPTTGSNTATKDLSQQGGGVGLIFSGAYLYSPYGGSQYGQTTNFETTATYAEGNSFDQCGGHSSSTTTASYHFHVPPSCLLKQLSASATAHSPQIGWAIDGFPLYGPRGKDGVEMKVCTSSQTYGTDQCTDACTGYIKTDATIDKFKYRYHMLGTYNDGTQCTSPSCPSPAATYYPFTNMCLRGCCPSGVTCSPNLGQSSLPACSAYTPTAGYTYTTATTVSSNGAGGDGADMASGLSQNTGGCACSSLACETSACSSQSWKSTTCRGSSGTNTCPAASSSPTPLPTPTPSSPSPSPTATTHTVESTVSLTGISAALFTTTERTSFKDVIASYLQVCGTAGATQCTSADVTIVSASRRDTVSVQFRVPTASSTSAANGANALNTAISGTNAATFKANLVAKGGNLASVTATSVAVAPFASSVGRNAAAGVAFSLLMALAVLFA